ncbi:gibberellin-regulated protein 14-like [Lactuca sativa]|uniref:gibberellin-regulated protein 14-like n=1 Tax=Lactuca sativa TaxID=4236 RepID=UPI000CD84D16|nr:gibberellin-regulated protein 14-like [Lactuca sativa]
MADSLLSSIATFHTTKIIITDPSKFFFIGSIPEAMYACVSEASNVIQEYNKLPFSAPKELTPAMIRSIEEADKPAKRGKKPEKQKDVRVIKPAKGKTPKKRKSDKTAPSQPKQKKLKKPARRLILQSSSDSDSDYVPPGNKPPTPTESENESSEEEASTRGDTPPRSPTPEVPIRSPVPSSLPTSIPISLPTTFPVITSQPTSTIPISTPLFSEATKTTTTRVQTNVSDTGVRSSVPETTKPLSPTPSTETNTVLGGEDMEFDSFYYNPYRHLKELNAKLDTLMASSSSHNPNSESAIQKRLNSFVKAHEASISHATTAITSSTKGVAKLNASKMTNSITNLEEAFATEKQNFVNLRQDIQKDNVALLSSLNEHFTKLQDDLAMENSLMD